MKDIPCARRKTVVALRNGFKCRTGLKICQSEAKYIEKSDFDVKTSLAPPKSSKNDEKLSSETEKKNEKRIQKLLGFENWFFSIFGRFWRS